MSGNAKRRPGGGGAAVIIGNEIAVEPTATTSKKQAGPAALDRACLSCSSPGVIGLCSSCEMERALERLADEIAEKAQILADAAGPSAPRLPVRPHLRQKPRRMRCSHSELEIALEWERLSEPDPHRRWWSATSALPASYVEAFPAWGRRDERGV